MRKGTAAATVLWAAFSMVAACGPGEGTTDAGTDASTGTDARTDTRPAETGPTAGPMLFNACSAPGMCMGTMPRCDQTFPGGSCTIRCTTSRQCGEGATCVTQLNQCYKACTEGGEECGPQEVCALIDSMTMQRACFPSCFSTPPAGQPGCASGTVCDPYAGACVDPATAMHMGADNGEPCANDDACKSGRCFAELNEDGSPSGFVGGMCFSSARSPNPSLYRPGMAIPQSNCPAGNVALPFVIFGISDDGGDGDGALCLKACTADSQCRPGYTCEKLTASGMSTTNGFCFQANCLAAARAAMPNNGCPSGYTCQRQMTSGTMPFGVCARGATDGGTPPPDASTPAEAGTPADAAAPVDATSPPADAETGG